MKPHVVLAAHPNRANHGRYKTPAPFLLSDAISGIQNISRYSSSTHDPYSMVDCDLDDLTKMGVMRRDSNSNSNKIKITPTGEDISSELDKKRPQEIICLLSKYRHF